MKKHFGLILVILLAFLLRLPNLGGSFWMDEAAQALESSRPFWQQHKIEDDFQPPLLHYIVHFMLILGKNEAWLRFVSVLSGLVTIAALYLILETVDSKRTALFTAILLAINPFHIFFSQELRPYALATAFACLSWLGLIKKSKNLFVFSTVGGLYSMYLYPFVLLSQLAYVFFERRLSFVSVLRQTFYSLILFLPWLPFFLGQLQTGTALAKALPGWDRVVSTPQLKALPLTLAKFILGQIDLKDSVVFLLLAGFVSIIFFIAVRGGWKNTKTRFLVYWFFVTVVTSWLVSFLVPVISPKRVMIALPAFVGILAVWIVTNHLKKLGIVLSIIFLGAWLMSIAVPRYGRENWRGLIRAIEVEASGRKAVGVFSFPESFAPWRWYSRGFVNTIVSGKILTKDKQELGKIKLKIQQFDQIFYFEYLRDLSDPDGLMKEVILESGFHEAGAIDGGTIGFVRLYSSM